MMVSTQRRVDDFIHAPFPLGKISHKEESEKQPSRKAAWRTWRTAQIPKVSRSSFLFLNGFSNVRKAENKIFLYGVPVSVHEGFFQNVCILHDFRRVVLCYSVFKDQKREKTT